MVEINLVLVFMIAAALIAARVSDLLSAVVAIGAVGIGLCMAFLALKAPDLAVMQLVVEILGLIILIRALGRHDVPFRASGRWVFNTIATISFMAVFLVISYFSLKALPSFGEAAMGISKFYIEKGASGVGAKNVVSAIVSEFRAYDTLGEVTVVFLAAIGVFAIARKKGHNA